MLYENKKAFTLSELLIALGIIGTIAAFTIPSLVMKLQNRMFVTHLKSITESVMQLVTDQMTIKHTKDLELTDLESADKFYSHFDVAYTCSKDNKCWGNSYTTLIGDDAWESNIPTVTNGVHLKDGSSIYYLKDAGTFLDEELKDISIQAQVFVDLNGSDSPNIIGRDLFSFGISKSGKIVGSGSGSKDTCDVTRECFQAVLDNGWTIPEKSKYFVDMKNF